MIRTYLKAIVGAVTAGLVTAYTALDDNVITTKEGILIALAVLGTGGGVAATRNKVTPATDGEAPFNPDLVDAGAAEVEPTA
jgi:hypothetical protein